VLLKIWALLLAHTNEGKFLVKLLWKVKSIYYRHVLFKNLRKFFDNKRKLRRVFYFTLNLTFIKKKLKKN